MHVSLLPGRGTPPLLRARPFAVVACALALVCALAPVAFAANLVKNGGFELGSEPGSSTPVPPGGNAIQDWTVSGNSIDYVSSAWLAKDGVRSVGLNGSAPGSIEQVFPTVTGMPYAVKFFMAGDVAGFVEKRLRVSAAGQQQDYLFDASHSWPWDMGWVEQTFVFTANAATATLKFTSLDAGDTGPAVDSVTVTGQSPIAVDPGPSLGFALARPLPNPATGPCSIQYTLPREAPIRLAVRNVAGREVAVLFAGKQVAGAHALTWGGDAAPGIYFVQLTAPGVSLVQRAVRIP